MNIDAYGDALSKLNAGSFIPDIAPKAPASQPLPDDGSTTPAASFKDTVKQLLDNVNDKLVDASQQSQDLATGKSTNFDGAIKSVEEATLAFQFTMAVRNKLMDAYTEIQQTNL